MTGGSADRLLVAAGCFVVAYSAHFIWNSPLLTEAFGEGAGILLGLVLKGIPVLVLLVVMYRLARRQEATWFRDAVAGEVGSDVLLREELDELMTLSSRKDVIKMVRRVRGKRAAKLVGQLQHAQLELGLACSRRGVTGEQDVEDARRTIRLLRVELAQQGVVRAGTLPRRVGAGGPAAGGPPVRPSARPASRAPRRARAPDRAPPAVRRSRSGSRPRSPESVGVHSFQ